MFDFTAVVDIFDAIVILLAAGMVVIAVSVNDGWRSLLLAATAIGAFGTLVLAAGQPREVYFPEFIPWLIGGAGGAVGLAMVVRGIFSMPVTPRAVGFLSWFGVLRQLGDNAKLALAPRCWREAKGKNISPRDLIRRCIVAVAAGTGGVVGSLMSLDLFWDSLKESFDVNGLFHSIVFSVVSITLVGPLHDAIMDRGLAARRHGTEVEDPDEKSILDNISLVTIARIALVGILFVAIDFTSTSLATCVRLGKVSAVYQILLGGLVPGLVSYYWSAAVQLGVASVRKSATWPSINRLNVVFAALGWFGGLYAAGFPDFVRRRQPSSAAPAEATQDDIKVVAI